MQYPTLDAHAHIRQEHSSQDLEDSGAVLAMTLSLDEADLGVRRREPYIAWGVGCHPRSRRSQDAFDIKRFEELLVNTAIAGEVGLDGESRVPLEQQLKNFREVLDVLSGRPCIISIHSYRASGLVLEELRHRPVSVAVLHWWLGDADETTQAVKLGCYFSIHSAIARQAKFRTRVPAERILVESDHAYDAPPAAIPSKIEKVEKMVAQQYRMNVKEIRDLVWRNLAAIVKRTGTMDLLPESLTGILSTLEDQGYPQEGGDDHAQLST